MSGSSRSRELVHAVLCGALAVGACMPDRVEVGRDSTLDVPAAGEAGAVGTGAGSSGGNVGTAFAAGRGGAGGNGGSAGASEFACPPEPSLGDALWTLDTFCRAFGCPSSVDDAKVFLLNRFSDCSGSRAEVSEGCDTVEVGMSASNTREVYVFQGNPPALVGAGSERDAPFGPCNVVRYFGGVMPRACDAVTTCTFCGPEATCPP